MRLFGTLCAAIWICAVQAAVQDVACGGSNAPCTVPGGTYHMAMPNEAPKGIVIHLHGAGATGQQMLRSGMGRAAVARGFVFVAPDGYHPGMRFERNWSVRATNSSFAKDDAVLLRAVLDDVRGRTGLGDARVMLTGFSRGGSMVWDMACHDPGFADAYAPVAGAFWDALPELCAAPVALFHTHGWTDRTVPLEGRSLRGGAIIQGDVWASLKILRETNGCDARQPERNSFEDEYWFRHWTDCAGGDIRLLLHKGGHGAPSGWAARMLDWFEETVG